MYKNNLYLKILNPSLWKTVAVSSLRDPPRIILPLVRYPHQLHRSHDTHLIYLIKIEKPIRSKYEEQREALIRKHREAHNTTNPIP